MENPRVFGKKWSIHGDWREDFTTRNGDGHLGFSLSQQQRISAKTGFIWIIPKTGTIPGQHQSWKFVLMSLSGEMMATHCNRELNGNNLRMTRRESTVAGTSSITGPAKAETHGFLTSRSGRRKKWACQHLPAFIILGALVWSAHPTSVPSGSDPPAEAPGASGEGRSHETLRVLQESKIQMDNSQTSS